MKYQPCIALFGEDLPPLFLAAFLGAPRMTSNNALWEIRLGVPQELYPGDAPDPIVDVSKLVTMPSHYHLPGARDDDGKDSWDYFRINDPKKRQFYGAVNPAELRQRIIDTLVTMIRQKPLEYVDSTAGLNETGLIKRFSWDEKRG